MLANQCSIEPPVPQPALEPCPGLCRPASWNWGACLMRLPQISELTSSLSFQSGPNSSTTTFLPARASTSAKIEPAGPAPTTTRSTFSLVAMSPPRLRLDMGHIGHAEPLEAFDRAVDDVDRVSAEVAVERGLRRALPAFVLALAHEVDELELLGLAQRRERLAVLGVAGFVDRGERGAIEVDERRPHIGDADVEQCLVRLDRALLIDEVGDAGLASARHEGFADRFERLRLVGGQHLERSTLGAGFARREHHLDAADRERECAGRGTLHERATFDGIHRHLPERALFLIRAPLFVFCAGSSRQQRKR